ncbi:hypothetical protein HMPREF9123_2518 [Neisseria bacilliformis ATCC BAA-1200]|uniref:Uncharacterized protein n=1 Tax=Neisseria bacilliformis ATCC BAA-1200 TaxID=888742 RepID=F2BFL1_9NEIS|nr:hypothetical protein HMPREF9123_2518 [Neisseria bacilliformis ATCC BAA-1200]
MAVRNRLLRNRLNRCKKGRLKTRFSDGLSHSCRVRRSHARGHDALPHHQTRPSENAFSDGLHRFAAAVCNRVGRAFMPDKPAAKVGGAAPKRRIRSLPHKGRLKPLIPSFPRRRESWRILATDCLSKHYRMSEKIPACAGMTVWRG